MSKKKAEKNGHVNELPEIFEALISRARDNHTPPVNDQDQQLCPTLHQLLSPRLVDNPEYNGNGTPNKVLREPLLMLSWDRAAGMWRFSLSDKVLNFSCSGNVSCLSASIAEIEAAVASGKTTFKMVKPK